MKTGFAVCDITPEPGIYLTGYGHPERLAAGVHSPLQAAVMVLQDEDHLAAVIALDWCFVDWELTVAIRRGIAKVSGIAEEHILLCCSHTHSAPHTAYMRTLGRVAVDPEFKGAEYALSIIPLLGETVCRALGALRCAEASFAAGKTETGVSRRGTDEYGNVTGFIADPDAVFDDNMTVVRFRDSGSGEDLGIIVHCSAHNTAMGLNMEYSSDWCGVMKERISQRFPVPILFLNGSFGDVGPRTNRFMKGKALFGYSAGAGDGARSAEEVGYRAASDALQLLENMRDFRGDLPVKLNVSTITLPKEIPMSEAQAKEIVERYKDLDPATAEPPVEYQVAKTALKTWSDPLEKEFAFEQTVVSFGPVALAPFPFEMFSVFSLRLRKYGPFRYTLLCSNTNGRNAYMPDRGAIACGGYEVSCRETIAPYVLKPEAGDLAVVQTLQSLRTMK